MSEPQRVGFEKQSTRKQIQYVPLQKNSESMNNSEKEGVKVWNLMVNTLREHGLMKDK